MKYIKIYQNISKYIKIYQNIPKHIRTQQNVSKQGTLTCTGMLTQGDALVASVDAAKMKLLSSVVQDVYSKNRSSVGKSVDKALEKAHESEEKKRKVTVDEAG